MSVSSSELNEKTAAAVTAEQPGESGSSNRKVDRNDPKIIVKGLKKSFGSLEVLKGIDA